jgi:hypothetical protein
MYEVQIEGSDGDFAGRLRRGQAVRRVERAVGVGDAWAFIAEADTDRNAAARDAWAWSTTLGRAGSSGVTDSADFPPMRFGTISSRARVGLYGP